MDKQTKSAVESGEMLPLMEAFYTIQGEGYYSVKLLIFYALVVVMLAAIGVMLRKVGMLTCIHQLVLLIF